MYGPTYQVTSWNDAVLEASARLLNGIVAVIPNVLGAIIVFLFGWLLALWVRSAIIKLLEMIQFDQMTSRTGIEAFLSASHFKATPKSAVASIVKWFIITVFFLAALSIIGLPVVADALNGIILYIPKVIASVLILAGGLVLADFLSNIVRGTLKTAQIGMAETLAGIAKWVLVTFTILAVIRQLEIVPDLINILFMGIVGSIALGLGLMVGLGGKDVMNDILREWYNRMKHQ